MRDLVEAVADVVYEWANRYVDRCPLSWPYYVIAIAAGRVLDRLDPVARSGSTF